MVDGWNIDRSRIGWWLLGLALAVAVLFVIHSFIGTFVFGIFIYYATRPVYRRLRRRVRPASLAAAASLLTLALPVLLLMTYTGAIALQEVGKVVRRLRTENALTDINGLWTEIQPFINASSVAQTPDQILANPSGSTDIVRETALSVLQWGGLIGTGLLHLFVMIAIAFYLLRDDHRLSRYTRRQFSDDGGVLEAYARAVDRDFNSIFFGNILNALMTGTIGAAAYNLVNLVAPPALAIPYPTLIGLLAGAASLIPVVGMKLVYFPVAGYLGIRAAIESPELLWFPALFSAVSLVVVDTIPDLVLRPYVSGRDLHVGMVMLAYIFGPLLFGWYGIFLGPMILVLVVHFVRIVLPELIAGEPIRPWAVDPTYLFEPTDPATAGVSQTASDETPRTDAAREAAEMDTTEAESKTKSDGPGATDSESTSDEDGPQSPTGPGTPET